MTNRVSRRFAVGMIGMGAAAAATVASGGIASTGKRATQPADPTLDPYSDPRSRVSQLVAPLQPGAALGDWTVVALHDFADGAASVVLASPSAGSATFQVDICARDVRAEANHGPAQTDHFELFVANEGDGTTATAEVQGLAAMALEEIVRANEASVDRTGYQTIAQCRALARRHLAETPV